MLKLGNLRLALAGLTIAALGLTGCSSPKLHSPQPSTWWGIRNLKKSDSGEKTASAKPKSNKPKSDKSASPAKADKADKPAPRQDADFNQAVRLIKEEKKFAEAQRILEGIVDRNPKDADAWRWLGDCHYNLMELSQAIEAYQKARELDQSNYFALRGKGFAHLHYGHQLWQSRQRGPAHDQYRQALEILQECLRIYPADSEAMYGRAMAAEGASRKLYANSVEQLRADKKGEAELSARNCLAVIDEGIEAAKYRINVNLQEVGPRALVGGLYLRRAMLQKEFGKLEQAIADIQQAAETQKSILSDIDSKNPQAQKELANCNQLLAEWRAQLEAGAKK